MGSDRPQHRARGTAVSLALTVVVAAAALQGCGTTRQAEARWSDRAAVGLESSYGVVRDADAEAYLARIGDRLNRSRDPGRRPLRIAVLDAGMPNAFALPDGRIYVTRGLIGLTGDEAELANAIAHEIVHVDREHTVRRMHKGVLPGLFTLPGQAVGVVLPRVGGVLAGPFERLQIATVAAYSREQEQEADTLGQAMARRAGYDPGGMTRILRKLAAVSEVLGAERDGPRFDDLHPETASRVGVAAGVARDIHHHQPAVSAPLIRETDEHRRLVEGLVFGPSPDKGVVVGDRLQHTGFNLGLDLPGGWSHTRTAQAFGALDPEGRGALVIDRLDTGAAATDMAEALVARLRQAGFAVDRTDPHTLGPMPAHTIRMTHPEPSHGPIDIRITFGQAREGLIRLIAVTTADTTETTDRAIESARPLTDVERRVIRVVRIRFVDVQPGETFDRLAERTGNVWTDEATRIINGLDADAPPPAGGRVKVGVEEPYANGR